MKLVTCPKSLLKPLEFGINLLELHHAPVDLFVYLVEMPNGYHGDSIDLDDRIEIRINSNSSDKVSTLFHELVHAKQYINDELILEGDHAVYHEKLYKREEIQYEDEPWEVEAFILEQKMMEAWTQWNSNLH